MANGAADHASSTAAPPPSPLARVGRLARKELSEILRDRRTIVTLVAMPLLLYPVMSIAFQQFFLASKLNPTRGPEYRLGFPSQAAVDVFIARLRDGDAALRDRGQKKATPVKDLSTIRQGPKLSYRIDAPDGLEAALRAGEIDLILKPPARPPGVPQRRWDITYDALYQQDSAGALGALSYIEQRLAAANELDLRRRLGEPGVRPSVVISLARLPIDASSRDSLVSLPALVPLILILMTITGAVYPAIDLTAGERERGTLETLVAAPVPRFALLFGKYIAVVTVAVLTAAINAVAMTITLVMSGLAPLVFEDGFSPLLLLLLFALLVLFAAFFSAVLLCLASFARSFKEAQAYLIPLMLASLAPGILGMLPGLKLDLLLSVVPLLNVVLLARDLLSGQAEPLLGLVIVATTLVYAVAALSLAARVFGSENVLYSEQSGWAELFRRPDEAQPTADVAAALWCLALMIPLHFALRAALPLVLLFGPTAVLLVLTAGSLLLFGALPLLFAYLGHIDVATGFRLGRPRIAALAAGLVLGCSLWPLVLESLALAHAGLPEFIQEHAADAVRSMRSAGLMALFPFVTAAICEELFFRGFLFQALRRVTGPRSTIVITALLFGLTHAALGGALGLGQLLPSIALGLVLGTVCWASGSVWPGLVLHVCHNAIMVVIAQAGFAGGVTDVPTTAARVVAAFAAPLAPGPLLALTSTAPASAEAGVPAAWLLLGAAGTAIGALLLWLGAKSSAAPSPSGEPASASFQAASRPAL